jgi:hypothetical protein
MKEISNLNNFKKFIIFSYMLSIKQNPSLSIKINNALTENMEEKLQ